ncbi:hypothetical protein EDB83DRAFT_2316214 [Lactarius deliciosus]|nr:hypothetical protein EDB83DRAFT_2316214 [Lactarius deliciosus]
MVSFHDSGPVLQDSPNSAELVQVLYLGNVGTTLGSEASEALAHHRRPFHIYSPTRVCTLVAVILNMLGFDASSPINCHLWNIFELILIFAYLAFAAVSLLIVLRIFAIWDGNIIAALIAMSAWLTNVAFLIHGLSTHCLQLRAPWVPVPGVCVVLNIESSKNTAIVTLVTDVILCLTMLVVLLRLRQNGTPWWPCGTSPGSRSSRRTVVVSHTSGDRTPTHQLPILPLILAKAVTREGATNKDSDWARGQLQAQNPVTGNPGCNLRLAVNLSGSSPFLSTHNNLNCAMLTRAPASVCAGACMTAEEQINGDVKGGGGSRAPPGTMRSAPLTKTGTTVVRMCSGVRTCGDEVVGR